MVDLLIREVKGKVGASASPMMSTDTCSIGTAGNRCVLILARLRSADLIGHHAHEVQSQSATRVGKWLKYKQGGGGFCF